MRISVKAKTYILGGALIFGGITIGLIKQSSIIAGYGILTGILSLFLPRFIHKEEDKKRKKEITNTYPEMVSKMSVLIGTGMTVRSSFERIVGNYKKSGQKNVLYEEMAAVLSEQSSGVSESISYEHLGRRCDVPEIWKFTHLLSLNLKTGQKNLADKLSEIARDAHNSQRREVRKRGEEAGTKLVFPMMIYLIIVFVIILVPAFSSLSFS